jgi:hypothetical protein
MSSSSSITWTTRIEAAGARTAAVEPSVLAPRAPKPPKWWILVTLAAGVGGSFAGITVAADGRYDIPPFTVELSATVAPAGKTEFEVKPTAVGVSPGFAEAGTHAAPLAFRATVTDVRGLVPSDAARLATPGGFAEFMKTNGEEAVRAFAVKTGLVSLLGSLLVGLAISMGRWQRIVGSLIAGVLNLAVLGGLTAATYDADEFKKTSFRPTDNSSQSILPGG